MNEMIFYMLLRICGLAEILVWAWGICQMKVTKVKWRWAVAVALYGGGLIGTSFMQEELWRLSIMILVNMIIFGILMEEAKSKKIVVYLFSFFYTSVVYEPVNYIFMLIRFLMGYGNLDDGIKILVEIIAIMIVILFAKQIQKRKTWVMWIREIPMKYYVLGATCAFSASAISTIVRIETQDVALRGRALILFLIVLLNTFLYAMGIGFAFVDLLKKQYRQENVLMDKYLQLSKEHFNSVLEHRKEVRSMEHDMEKHFNSLSRYAESAHWEKMVEYLEDFRSGMPNTHNQGINVNNELVSAILMDGMPNVKEKIAVKCEGVLPDTCNVTDFDLCTIFSNLLSNGIEACKKLEETEKKIELEIKSLQTNLVIIMENPVEWEVDLTRMGEWTSKNDRDKHGYGIHNVKKTVDKYKGEIAFKCENGMFRVEIILLNVISRVVHS